MHLLTLALTTLTLTFTTGTFATQYHVTNCGPAQDQSSNAGATQSACQAVDGTFCDRTGLNRCVVTDDSMEQFKGKCQEQGLQETYVMPAAMNDEGSARRYAGCL